MHTPILFCHTPNRYKNSILPDGGNDMSFIKL